MSLIPTDNLQLIFGYLGDCDVDIATVCKEWNEVSLARQWEKLNTAVAKRKDVNQDWWKEKIDAVQKTCFYTTSARAFFRVLRSLISEDASPYCSQFFRQTVEHGNAIPSFYSTIETDKVKKGLISKKVAVWLSVEEIVKVNKAYIRFANKVMVQTSALALPNQDRHLIPMQRRVERQSRTIPWLAPPISSHMELYFKILRQESWEFALLINREIDESNIPSALFLSARQKNALSTRFKMLISSIQVDAWEFREWQKSQIKPVHPRAHLPMDRFIHMVAAFLPPQDDA